MKTKSIIPILVAAVLSACGPDPNSSTDSSCGCSGSHYTDFYGIVVEKSNVPNKHFLIHGVDDPTLFAEVEQDKFGFHDSVYYTKMPGDTVYFKKIKKNRFWHQPVAATAQPAKPVKTDSLRVTIVGPAPTYKREETTVTGPTATALRDYATANGLTKDAAGTYVFAEQDFAQVSKTQK